MLRSGDEINSMAGLDPAIQALADDGKENRTKPQRETMGPSAVMEEENPEGESPRTVVKIPCSATFAQCQTIEIAVGGYVCAKDSLLFPDLGNARRLRQPP